MHPIRVYSRRGDSNEVEDSSSGIGGVRSRGVRLGGATRETGACVQGHVLGQGLSGYCVWNNLLLACT